MEEISKTYVHKAYVLLKTAFVLLPIVAGLDKFFEFFVIWGMYLVPYFGSLSSAVMLTVGVVEIILGLGVMIKPKLFANLVGFWLLLIILNLIALGGYYDIAFRDFCLCLSSFALGKLAKAYN